MAVEMVALLVVCSIGCDGGFYGRLHAAACIDLSFLLSSLLNLILVSVISVHF